MALPKLLFSDDVQNSTPAFVNGCEEALRKTQRQKAAATKMIETARDMSDRAIRMRIPHLILWPERIKRMPTSQLPHQTEGGRYFCLICNQPIKLENARTDGDGHTVHAKCYLNKLLGKIAPKRAKRRE